MKRLTRALLVAFLISPFLLILLFETRVSIPPTAELLRTLRGTFFQAAASSVISVALGFLGATGLVYWSSRKRYWEMVCLFPNFIPPLFIILSTLNIISPFPFGWTGIILVHSLINVGVASVVIEQLWRSRIGGMADLAYVEGASRGMFFQKAVLGYLRGDLALLMFWIFTACFTSFSIPLVLGGGKGVTLDVLLYEKIRIEGDWAQATGIALIQMLFLFAVSKFLSRESTPTKGASQRWPLLSWKWGLLVPLLVTLFLVAGLFKGLWGGLVGLWNLPELGRVLIPATLGTVFVGLATGALCWAFLNGLAFGWPNSRLEKFLTGFSSPSVMLTAFGFLLVTLRLSPSHPMTKLPWISLALTATVIPTLFRLRMRTTLSGLTGQMEVARTLGATDFLIFRRIVRPQIRGTLGFLSGVAAFWATGEFALTGIVAGSDSTLALVVQALMGSYRLEMATALIWWMLLVGVFCYFVFRGLGRNVED